jgi:hypothetical protein
MFQYSLFIRFVFVPVGPKYWDGALNLLRLTFPGMKRGTIGISVGVSIKYAYKNAAP